MHPVGLEKIILKKAHSACTKKAKITEHMLEFGWGEGWGIKLIWLTWWNSLLLQCEPLPCHEDFDSKNTEETRPKQITGEKTTAEIQYGGGTRRLGNRSPDSDLRFCRTPPLISACSHLRIPWMCSPMRSTKKQGEGIIIARGKKKHLEIKHSCGWEKKTRVWIWAARAWVMYSPTEICSSPIRPLIPNDLSEGEQMQQIRNE